MRYYYDLICHLVWRDFMLRYKGSVLGILWSLVPPFAHLLVLVFLFGKVVPLNIRAYPVFVFSALLPWIWFSTCLNSAGYLFTGNRELVRRPNFEPATLVTVNALSNLLHLLIFLPILLLMLVIYDRNITISFFLLPVLILIQAFLTVGLGLFIATASVFYHDVQHLANVTIMLIYFLTPIFYPSQNIPEKYQFIFSLNPIALLIENYRAVFFYGSMPEWNSVFLAGVISMALFGVGYFVYRRQVENIYDVL